MIDSELDLHFADLGFPAAPAGQIDLPAGGARSASPAGRSVSLTSPGAAGTPNIDKMTVDFKINSKLNIFLIRPFHTGVCEIKAARPYGFIGIGAIDVTKPCKFIWFGDIDGPKTY